GVFVLALTSNPDGPEVQHAKAESGGTVAGAVLASVRAENARAEPPGSVGAVVAANLASTDEDLAVNGPLLAPGLGAQGGSVDDLRRIFAGVTSDVLPSTSRAVLATGPSADALRSAAVAVMASVRAL
ncbi:MAG: orotidine-5'-phosphate decarboxylase, partial [Nocardioidaceae bacterium]